jgi:coproporphyrinogen III oxidase-like Fe-S oxidoreductase
MSPGQRGGSPTVVNISFLDRMGDNINTINKITETLIDASKEIGIEINVEEIKYMLVSREQNAGQNRYIKTGNGSFENVSQFKYL